MSASLQTILFLAANPKDTARRRLDQELRDIDEGLQRSRNRDQFTLEKKLAVRPRDIQRAMLDVGPQIVHFSGHSDGEMGLQFEDEVGNAKLVDGAALARLFALFADQVSCVVLNGCYSQAQAEAIAQHVPYVIGMSKDIDEDAAIAFAVGFYDALGAGRDVEFAYKLGCTAISLEGVEGYLTPILLKHAQEEVTATPIPAASSPVNHEADGSIEVFISYSHKDDALQEELIAHLSSLRRRGNITAWYDRAVEAGAEWEAQIKDKLETAQVILMLISPAFMASDYCYDIEMQRALERHEEGTARVIPVILRPCDWREAPFSKLKAMPEDGKPVTQWGDRDTAFLNVVQGIKRALESLTKK